VSCESLAGLSLPDTQILRATEVAGSGPAPAFDRIPNDELAAVVLEAPQIRGNARDELHRALLVSRRRAQACVKQSESANPGK
jgi:hypothetical protein